MHGLALAALLAATPLWARVERPAGAAAHAAKAARQDAATVAQQRAEVQRLRHDVAAQESGSRTAAERLKRQDAEIAELQRQLQAARQAAPAPGAKR